MLKQIALHIIPKISVIMSAALLLSGCISEDFNNHDDTENASAEGEAEVTFTISCGYNQEVSEDFSDAIPADIFSIIANGDTVAIPYSETTRATRADGTPKDPEHTCELIHDWILYFTQNNKVVKILKRSDAETCIEDPNSIVEEETFKCHLPYGSLTVYAFANVTEEELTACGWTYTIGAKLSNSSTYVAITWDDTMTRPNGSSKNLSGWSASYPIPMSGFRSSFSVGINKVNHFSIEMIRMVARINMVFTNKTDKDVYLSSYYFGPSTSKQVPLFPLGSGKIISYDHLGNSCFTAAVSESAYFLSGYAPKRTLQKDATFRAYFYNKESRSWFANDKSFTVSIKVTHDGATEIQQYRQLRDIKEYINRNDWIVIPINISRYDVKVKALFYPAIGTYPAVQSDFDQYGYQIFKFKSSGEFAIVTEVTDKETDRLLSPAEYKVNFDTSSFSDLSGVIQGGVAGLQVEDGSIGFPTEIIGTLTGNKGTASMKLNIELPKADGSSQTYIRDIYIVGE